MELWFSERLPENAQFSIRTDKQLYSAQSPFQRITCSNPSFGRFLTLDGYIMLTEKDEFIYTR